jgi:hypothetical protein
MKKFKIPCFFNGEKVPFDLYVGAPASDFNPLYFQMRWLTDLRGGFVPGEVMDSFHKLHNIALENKVDLEELAMYALGSAAKEKLDDAKEEEVVT